MNYIKNDLGVAEKQPLSHGGWTDWDALTELWGLHVGLQGGHVGRWLSAIRRLGCR